MFVRRALMSVIAALSLAACRDDDPVAPRFVDFTSATATNACLPSDGPAVGIMLQPKVPAGAAPSFVNILIPVPLARAAGTWHTDDGATRALLIIGASSFANAGQGTIRITRVEDTRALEGSVDLVFPNDGRVVGSFRAMYLPNKMLCG